MKQDIKRGTSDRLQNASFLVWKVTRDRKQARDCEVTRLYNLRARHIEPTKH